MSEEIFEAAKVIDREAEKEIFYELLKFKDDARLLTIEDSGGKGKTSFLKRLKHECWNYHDIPIALIQLEQLQDKSPFSLVSEIRKELNREELNLHFPQFDALNSARRLKIFAPFSALHSFAQGTISMGQSTVSGDYNKFIGMYIDKLEIQASPNWDGPEQEEIAREECIKAFFRELKEDHKDRPLVILLDTYERSGDILYQWIQYKFLRLLCFDITNRPKRLVVVLAGRRLPDFRDLLGNAEKYEQLVRSIKSFGTWDENRVKEFLAVHDRDYETLKDEEIKVICAALKLPKFTLTAALNLARNFVEGE